MPVYHSGKLKNTDRPHYNYPLRPAVGDLTSPLAPRNLMVTSPYNNQAFDVRWDNPSIIPQNSGLQILGCNVYRSTDSEFGPYVKVNDTPVTVLFYRDETKEEEIVNEIATATIRQPDQPDGRWLVFAQHRPIVMAGTNGKIANRSQDVKLEIDDGDGNYLEIPAFSVNGRTGEIALITWPIFNHELQQVIPPRLPYPPNGRVRITYRYLAHQVLLELNQRIFYKVTTLAVDPKDSTKTIETPLEEVSDRSAFDIEEIDYIWREAILRNQYILEQGGERVKVFVRKWMGEKCDSYQYTYGQSHHNCEQCFPAGNLVCTLEGYKDIAEIKEGEKVLSSDGHFHKVLEIFKRDYNGEMCSIETSVTTKPILVTPNHPFLYLKSDHHVSKDCCPMMCDSYIKRGDGIILGRPDVRLLRNGRWVARAQINGSRGKGRETLGTYITKQEAIEAINNYKNKKALPKHRIEWSDAKDIKKGNWLVPRWSSYVHDMDKIEIPYSCRKKGKTGPKRIGSRQFKVDEEFLWVIGLYLAEGSCGTRSITFALHQNEIDFQNRVISFFEKYGYKAKIYRKKNNKGVVVHISSSSLSEWFYNWIGHRCDKKRIPIELMFLPKNKSWSLIKGIYDGDGSKSCNEITQTSEILARQLMDLLHRVGEQPVVRRQISKSLTPKGNARKIAYAVNWAEDTLDRKNRKGRWICKGEILSKVRKISKISFSGKVFNLKVEGDPTYVVGGLVVHNCYGTNIQGGFSGPYDIIIAPPETEKSIELTNMGLHVRYDWMTWTMNWPMLNPRDIIVRQNNERYIVGPVNYQGQRGAIFQQHFTISFIDHGDIRYKIGIEGGETQVPESTDLYREERKSDASPVINEKPEIPQERIIRGRTVTFENISY